MASTPTSTSGQRLLPSPPLHMWAPSESATPPTSRAAGRVTRRYPLLYKHFIEPTKGGIDGRTTLERLQARASYYDIGACDAGEVDRPSERRSAMAAAAYDGEAMICLWASGMRGSAQVGQAAV